MTTPRTTSSPQGDFITIGDEVTFRTGGQELRGTLVHLGRRMAESRVVNVRNLKYWSSEEERDLFVARRHDRQYRKYRSPSTSGLIVKTVDGAYYAPREAFPVTT